MFYFVTLTFNHENYIIEHLESIKYQIEKFGSRKKNNLILMDDCSQDDTIGIAKKWIEANQDLFYSVTIKKAEINKGIVPNYLEAIQSVPSDCMFRILGGDDLYYINSVYDAVSTNSFLVSPVIQFSETDVYSIVDRKFYFLLIKNNVESVKKLLKYGNVFSAPGVFVGADLLKNPNYSNYLTPFRWVEDYPTWRYFFYGTSKFNFCTSQTPYILYRNNSGIGAKNKRNKNTEYTRELKFIDSLYKIPFRQLPEFYRPKRYLFGLKFFVSIIARRKTRKGYKLYKSQYSQEVLKAEEHITYLVERSRNFIESINYVHFI